MDVVIAIVCCFGVAIAGVMIDRADSKAETMEREILIYDGLKIEPCPVCGYLPKCHRSFYSDVVFCPKGHISIERTCGENRTYECYQDWNDSIHKYYK